VQRPELFADPGVAGIGARGNRGQGKARVKLRRQVFQRVHRKVDASVRERLLDLLDEDALAACKRRWRWQSVDAVGLLHAVARGANDLDLNGVAEGAELRGDVVGLPESKLRASRAYADRFNHVCFQRYRTRL